MQVAVFWPKSLPLTQVRYGSVPETWTSFFTKTMKTLTFLLALLPLATALFGQQKSATPLPANNRQPAATGQTWAVVVGISDYQEAAIPDLRFADKDAEAFAQFLRSPGGGALDEDHLKVFVNQNATGAKVLTAFDWLLDVCREGDQAIIYFSGHGDVERKTISQPGYLLCWDAPPQVYKVGGTVKVEDLKDIVATLSLQNKTRIVVITDACHAGKLAGESFGGAQATTANLAQTFANEIKILSCQPNEFSLEGEQWGGGHGAFSYHLVDGLYGLADKNKDAGVTLSEIDRYLEERVTAEVSPLSQIPMVVGNKAERIASVNAQVLSQLQQYKSGQLAAFSPTDSRGLEDEVLTGVDSSIRARYFAFKKALQDKRYFEPAGDCAEDHYAVLSAEPGLRPLYGFMKRNYAAELQDNAQQAVKRILFRANEETHIWFSPGKIRSIYGPYPRMLERAATLLGPEHYMYSILLARKAFFEGGIICLQKVYFKDLVTGAGAVSKFQESLALEPNAPHTKLWMAWTYYFNMQNRDSAYYYVSLAIEDAPLWVLPRAMKVRFLTEDRKLDQAKAELDKLLAIDSTDLIGIDQLSNWYMYQGKLQESIAVYDTALAKINGALPMTRAFVELNKILPLGFLKRKEEALRAFHQYVAYDSLSGFPYHFLANMYYFVREYDQAVHYLKIALEKDPSMIWCYSLMGDVLIVQQRFEEAEQVLGQGLDRDSTYMPLVNALGGVYQATGRLELAEARFKRAIELDGAFMAPWFNLSTIYARTERFPEALDYLDKAIQLGLRNYDQIQNASALAALRELPEYKTLMRKHFPNKVKD